MLFIHDMFVFLSNVHWVQLVVTLIATLIAIVLGVWLPGRLLELHTNQPAARYVWYVASLIVMVMIYISMYGYGHFWQLYSDSEETQQAAPLHREE